MSASASLLTGKNRRRALQALIAAPLLALGIAAGSGTAHASTPATFRPAEVHLSNGYCSVSGWPGGTIYCGTSRGANLPNRTQEIFGIGLDGAVWTDWGTEAHPSGWKLLDGPTSPIFDTCSGCLGLANTGNYQLHVVGLDYPNHIPHEDDRSAGPSGEWDGWW
jgi:hypothetical protein